MVVQPHSIRQKIEAINAGDETERFNQLQRLMHEFLRTRFGAAANTKPGLRKALEENGINTDSILKLESHLNEIEAIVYVHTNPSIAFEKMQADIIEILEKIEAHSAYL